LARGGSRTPTELSQPTVVPNIAGHSVNVSFCKSNSKGNNLQYYILYVLDASEAFDGK